MVISLLGNEILKIRKAVNDHVTFVSLTFILLSLIIIFFKATPRNRPLKQGTPQNRYASPRSCSQGALYQASKFFLSAR